MTPILNAKQRNEAFVKFISFFIVTLAIIVAAVYFDYQLPLKDNEILRAKIRSYENQIYNQQQFIAGMETAKKLTDSIGKSEQFNALLDQEAARQLEALKSPLYQDSTIYATMNKDVFSVFYDYYELNKRLLQLKDETKQAEKLKQDLTQCQANFTDAQRTIAVLSRANNLGTQ